jgi:tripartite-type tricarboxylate transporter receptor subunit TctC
LQYRTRQEIQVNNAMRLRKGVRNTLGVMALSLAVIGLSLSALGAVPPHYPNKLIKLVVPLTAGGPPDVAARLTATALSSRLGQTVIVENHPGGGGTAGARLVAAADPDGHTLLFAGVTVAIAPAMYKNLGYDTDKSFAPIGSIGTASWVLMVPSSLPVTSVQEFVAYAKANPGKLNFGFGLGTGPHLIGEMFIGATGIEVARISYKGGAAQAVPDLLGGHIQMNFGTIPNILPLIQEGRVRALATTSEARSADLPDVPTMIESGLSRLTRGFWVGLLAPASTPADIVKRLNAEINASAATPKMRTEMSKAGFDLKIGSPQDLAALIADDIEVWGAAAKSAGIVPQ